MSAVPDIVTKIILGTARAKDFEAISLDVDNLQDMLIPYADVLYAFNLRLLPKNGVALKIDHLTNPQYWYHVMYEFPDHRGHYEIKHNGEVLK